MRTLVALGTFVIFTVLTVILLKHHMEEIPVRDLYTSALLFALCVVASAASVLFLPAKKSLAKQRSGLSPRQHHRPSEFARASNRLMQLEVVGTLVVPWLVLRASKWVDRHLDLPSAVVERLLVPHLYFFQAQIAAEAVLFATHQDWLLLPYTCVANALRGLPLGTWIVRSLVESIQSVNPYNPFHWLIVAGLPAVGTGLWLYSSLVFIPLIWYPVATRVTAEDDGGFSGYQY
jgi:hypothetical protein